MEYGRLRRVDVLSLSPAGHVSPAERDDGTACVPDWEHHAIAPPQYEPPVISPEAHARRYDVIIGEPRAQPAHHSGSPSGIAHPDAEPVNRILRQVAGADEPGELRRHALLHEDFLQHAMKLHEPPQPSAFLLAGPIVIIGNLYAELGGNRLNRLGEGHAIVLPYEIDGITAIAMDEAMPRSSGIVIHHAWMPRVLVMAQWAERLVHAGHPHPKPLKHGAYGDILADSPYRICRNPSHTSEMLHLPEEES